MALIKFAFLLRGGPRSHYRYQFYNDAMSVEASFDHRRRSEKRTLARMDGRVEGLRARTFGKILKKWRNSFESRENDLCIFSWRGYLIARLLLTIVLRRGAGGTGRE